MVFIQICVLQSHWPRGVTDDEVYSVSTIKFDLLNSVVDLWCFYPLIYEFVSEVANHKWGFADRVVAQKHDSHVNRSLLH